MSGKTRSENIDELISDFSRFYILTILYEGPSHGYSIISRFRKRVKKEVSPSLFYPFLKQLEEKGLVKHTIKPVGEKERKIFELTQAGIELCTDLFKRFAELVAVAIEPASTFAPTADAKSMKAATEKSSTAEKQRSAAYIALTHIRKQGNWQNN